MHSMLYLWWRSPPWPMSSACRQKVTRRPGKRNRLRSSPQLCRVETRRHPAALPTTENELSGLDAVPHHPPLTHTLLAATADSPSSTEPKTSPAGQTCSLPSSQLVTDPQPSLSVAHLSSSADSPDSQSSSTDSRNLFNLKFSPCTSFSQEPNSPSHQPTSCLDIIRHSVDHPFRARQLPTLTSSDLRGCRNQRVALSSLGGHRRYTLNPLTTVGSVSRTDQWDFIITFMQYHPGTWVLCHQSAWIHLSHSRNGGRPLSFMWLHGSPVQRGWNSGNGLPHQPSLWAQPHPPVYHHRWSDHSSAHQGWPEIGFSSVAALHYLHPAAIGVADAGVS